MQWHHAAQNITSVCLFEFLNDLIWVSDVKQMKWRSPM